MATPLALTKEPPELRDALARLRDDGDRVVVEEDGKPVGALVSLADMKALEQLEDLLDVQDYREALAEWERDGRRTVPLEIILRECGEARDQA